MAHCSDAEGDLTPTSWPLSQHMYEAMVAANNALRLAAGVDARKVHRAHLLPSQGSAAFLHRLCNFGLLEACKLLCDVCHSRGILLLLASDLRGTPEVSHAALSYCGIADSGRCLQLQTLT